MATLYENYNTGDTAFNTCYGATWNAQTFTPSIAHKITSVKLLISRIGSPGTLTVGIRATGGSSHPTGADLVSGTTNGNTLTTNNAGEWREVTLGAGYSLSASTKYAIVIRATGGDVSNKVSWRMDDASPTYTDGSFEHSTDSGSAWTTYTIYDQMFEDWGDPIVAAAPGSNSAILTMVSEGII